jgi:integrase
MPKIKNIRYNNFIKNGVIETISEQELIDILDKIKGKNVKQARALVICMYYTGARPAEILELKAKDVTRKTAFVVINIRGSKRGLPRPIYLQFKKPLVKEFYNFCISNFEEAFLFFDFKGKYIRSTPKGKEYIETTYKLRYYFSKWFNGINPYFLRHNRFSKLSGAGLAAEEIRILKGGRTLNSVFPYLHLSTKTAKKLARKID